MVDVDEIGALVGLDEGVEQAEQADRDHACDGHGDDHPPPPPVQDHHQPAAEHDEPEDARPDHDDVDDPLRDGVEPAQQIRREGDERVAEQPLEEDQRQHDDGRDDEPKHVGRRVLDRLQLGPLDPAIVARSRGDR